MTLPDATPKPCNDCPWRRNALPGWLGPYSVERWLEVVNTDVPIACHQTLVNTDDRGVGDWSDESIMQCRGAAIYRANTCKLPRDPEVVTGPVDRETVFAHRSEFLGYHR